MVNETTTNKTILISTKISKLHWYIFLTNYFRIYFFPSFHFNHLEKRQVTLIYRTNLNLLLTNENKLFSDTKSILHLLSSVFKNTEYILKTSILSGLSHGLIDLTTISVSSFWMKVTVPRTVRLLWRVKYRLTKFSNTCFLDLRLCKSSVSQLFDSRINKFHASESSSDPLSTFITWENTL